MRTTAKARNIDQTLMALANPIRRAILQKLSNGELQVTKLAKPFDISLNAVSKHIQVLERARLVRRRVDGRMHFLAFNPKPLAEAVRWMETQQAFWTARLDALEELLKAEDRASARVEKKSHNKKGESREH
jgi:DNA-binding transcriptional ArsR family regulator